MKNIIKIALAVLALVALASCTNQAPTVPSYAPAGGGYIMPSK